MDYQMMGSQVRLTGGKLQVDGKKLRTSVLLCSEGIIIHGNELCVSK